MDIPILTHKGLVTPRKPLISNRGVFLRGFLYFVLAAFGVLLDDDKFRLFVPWYVLTLIKSCVAGALAVRLFIDGSASLTKYSIGPGMSALIPTPPAPAISTPDATAPTTDATDAPSASGGTDDAQKDS